MEPASSSLSTQRFLTSVNGLFASIEIAYMALKRQRMKAYAKEGDRRAKKDRRCGRRSNQ